MSVASKKSRRQLRREDFYRRRQDRAVNDAITKTERKYEDLYVIGPPRKVGYTADGREVREVYFQDPPDRPEKLFALPEAHSLQSLSDQTIEVRVLAMAERALRMRAVPMVHEVKTDRLSIRVRWWNWEPR